MEGRSLRLAETKVCQGSQSTRGIAATDSNRGRRKDISRLVQNGHGAVKTFGLVA